MDCIRGTMTYTKENEYVCDHCGDQIARKAHSETYIYCTEVDDFHACSTACVAAYLCENRPPIHDEMATIYSVRMGWPRR